MGPLPKKRHHQAFWAADLKVTKSCRTQGESVGPYFHPSVCLSVPPWSTRASQALSEAGSSPSELGPRPHRAWLRPQSLAQGSQSLAQVAQSLAQVSQSLAQVSQSLARSYRGNVKGTADHLLPLSDWLGSAKNPHMRDCLSIHWSVHLSILPFDLTS